MISLVEKTIENISQILRSYSRGQIWLIGTGVGLAGVLFLLPIDYSPDQVASVLTTLAIVQASILGIVFSVSLLGVQLIANRYSPRMMTLVTSDTIFRGTVVLFVVSTGFALFIVLALPNISPEWGLSGVAVAGGLAGAFGVGLIRSVETILQRSTPEGVLEAYSNDISVEKFRERVRESKDTLHQHPLYDLHDVSMSALSRHEWSTAKNGIRYTERISIQIIEAETERGNLDPTQDDLAHDFFRVPLEEYLPRTAHRAVDTQQDDLAKEAISAIQAIGSKGVENGRAHIAEDSVSGLRSIFRETLEKSDGQILRVKCLGAFATLFCNVSEKPAPRELKRVLSSYSTVLRIWLGRDYAEWEYEEHLADFYRNQIALGLGAYLEETSDTLESVNIDWNAQSTADRHSDEIDTIYWILRYTFETSHHIFRYTDRNGEWPLYITSFRRGLLEICKRSMSGPEGLTKLLVRHYIDTAYIVSRLDSRDIASSWTRALVAEDEIDDAIVDDALEKCSSEGMLSQYQSFINRIDKQQDSESNTQKLRQVVTGRPKTYPEWLEEFTKEISSNRNEATAD